MKMSSPTFWRLRFFCSFSPLSVIPAMAQHAGREELKHPKLFHSFLERAAAEKASKHSCVQAGPVDVAAVATKDTLDGFDGIPSDQESEANETAQRLLAQHACMNSGLNDLEA